MDATGTTGRFELRDRSKWPIRPARPCLNSAGEERHPVFSQFGSELFDGLIVVGPNLKPLIMTYSD